jgi:sulfite exporter TauE/SafE
VIDALVLTENQSATAPLLFAVLSASLVGSVHCAGMCGPFVAVYSVSGPGRDPGRRATRLSHLAYHGTRGVGYVALGALGGAAGRALNWAGNSVGVAQFAALFCSILVLLWGASVVFPVLRIRSPVARFFGPKLAQLGTKPRVFRASLLGALTPLLPCGWLYAFVATAAGTGSVFSGALLMATFWIGTVPALLGMGALLSRLGERLRARVPVLTGVALIFIGGLGVVQRVSMLASGEVSHKSSAPVPAGLTVPSTGVRCH